MAYLIASTDLFPFLENVEFSAMFRLKTWIAVWSETYPAQLPAGYLAPSSNWANQVAAQCSPDS
ncbi:MAG: hypothetical protein ABI440_15645 [Casimicrobiaceae bacterium]